MALSIRMEAAIMMLPFVALFFLIQWMEERETRKENVRDAIAFVLVIMVMFLIETIANQGEWKEYIAYDKARQTMVDYSGYPDYYANKELYEQNGISESSYLAMTNGDMLLLDANVNKNSFQAISSLVSKHKDGRGVKEIGSEFIYRSLFDYVDRPLNLLVYVLYIFVGVSVLFHKNIRGAKYLIAIVFARMIIWGYLLYIDRAPVRITQGVYFCELILLFAMIRKEKLCDYPKQVYRIGSAILLIGLVFGVSVKWGIPNERLKMDYVRQRLNFIKTYTDFRAYMNQNPNDFYYLDTDSFRYFGEPLITRNKETQNNYVYLGSWTANTPWTKKLAERKGISDYESYPINNGNAYFVFMDTEATRPDYLVKYYEEKYPECEFVEADEWTSSKGVLFTLYQIKK